jgi:hypothetical protein
MEKGNKKDKREKKWERKIKKERGEKWEREIKKIVKD